MQRIRSVCSGELSYLIIILNWLLFEKIDNFDWFIFGNKMTNT